LSYEVSIELFGFAGRRKTSQPRDFKRDVRLPTLWQQ